MITAAYNAGKITINFNRPILQVSLPAGSFFINDVLATSVIPGTTTDTLDLASPIFSSQDDIRIEYKRNLPEIYYLSGPASDRIVQAFTTKVLITNSVPTVFNLSNTSTSPVLGDFISAYGLQEAIMLTNPDDALSESPDEEKFLRALEDAEYLWNSYTAAAPLAKKVLVSAGKRRTILIFVRYLLDTRCRRKIVTADYENAIEELNRITTTTEDITDPELYVNSEDIIYGYQTYCDSTCQNCLPEKYF